MKNQVRAYFYEAKLIHQKYIPTVHEYMQIATVSSGYPLLATTCIIGWNGRHRSLQKIPLSGWPVTLK
jgi:hypothetical protein